MFYDVSTFFSFDKSKTSALNRIHRTLFDEEKEKKE
jgi:hypothetical protein